MVIHIDTRVLDEERLLAELMDDVALITVLGVMPVLVISIRDQVDARLREMEVQPRFHSECDSITWHVRVGGLACARRALAATATCT